MLEGVDNFVLIETTEDKYTRAMNQGAVRFVQRYREELGDDYLLILDYLGLVDMDLGGEQMCFWCGMKPVKKKGKKPGRKPGKSPSASPKQVVVPEE